MTGKAALHSEVDAFRGGVLGYTVFKRTYSAPFSTTTSEEDSDVEKPLEKVGASSVAMEQAVVPRTENFEECIERMLNSNLVKDFCKFSADDRSLFKGFLLEQKCSLSGRCLQRLGIPSGKEEENGFLPFASCAVTTVDHPVRPFIYTAKLSLLGVGVGYSVQKMYVDKLPKVVKTLHPKRVDSEEAKFIVKDSREGWIELMEALLSAYFGLSKKYVHKYAGVRFSFTYSFHLLKESGSEKDLEGLEMAIKNVTEVLGARAGQKARPIDCMDVMNILAPAAVLGRTRRAALLAIGDLDDQEFLRAKRWDLGMLPLWRSASNNSVACDDISKLPEEFWEGYKGKGEAMGLVNLNLFRTCGRVGETQYPDPDVVGVSACAEQGLGDEEVSVLAELMLPHFGSQEELWEATRLLYSVCKNKYLLQPNGFPKTKTTGLDHFRMGIGVTGYMQASEEQKKWLSENYERLRSYDETYSKERGLKRSIKLTTIKPSGTVSILSGNTPGCHPGFARYFIRRVRFNPGTPLLDECKDMGLFIESERGFDGKPSPSGRQVVEFPCKLSDSTQLAENTTAVQQLDVVRRLQKEWSDSAVSVTIYYRMEELDDIREWLKQNYSENVKACSFLLHSDHGFDQAPYEKISADKYYEIQATKMPPAQLGKDQCCTIL